MAEKEDREFPSKGVLAGPGGRLAPVSYPGLSAVHGMAPTCNKPPRPEDAGPVASSLCFLLACVLIPEQSTILDVLRKEAGL